MTDEKCLQGFLEGLEPLHTIFGLANHELKNVLQFVLCMLIHTTFIARERESTVVLAGCLFPAGWGWGMGYGFPTGWGWGMNE